MKNSGLSLAGTRVLDFTTVFAGPFITLWMGALGAEIIKVESATRPDLSRRLVPDEQGGLRRSNDTRVGFWEASNYSKLDITLDMRKKESLELVREVIYTCDAVVECFSGEVMEKWGLDYASLRRIKPDIVMVSLSGFGRTGPYRNHRAFGHVGSSFGGIDHLTGYPEGRPVCLGSVLDTITSLCGVFGALTAFHHRKRTGEGQHVDLCMAEAQMAMIPEAMMDYSMNKRVRERKGNKDDVAAPNNCYPCKGNDSWVAITVTSDEEWRGLCRSIGRRDMISDPRFADPYVRWANQGALDQGISAWTRRLTPDEATSLLQRAGVPAGPVTTVVDLLNDLHLKKRKVLFDIHTRELGPVTIQRLPGLADGKFTPAPLLGEHNDYVFGELLALPTAEYCALIQQKVIY